MKNGEIKFMFLQTNRMRFKSRATLKYGKTHLVALIDQQIINYYYKLIPKYKYAQPQTHPAHITVVRSYPIEIIKDKLAWNKYEGQTIDYEYSNKIYFNDPYFYLRAYSKDIENIRLELGLDKFRSRFDCYHITIGNTKGNNSEN